MDIHRGVLEKLRKLMDIPEDFTMFIGGSATYFMKKIVQNCIQINSFHFVNGSFSRRFYEISRDSDKQAGQLNVGLGQGFDLYPSLPKINPKTELIAFTACETSTGVQTSIKGIEKISKANPQALIALDIVSAAPLYKVDFNFVDAAFFFCPKRFWLACWFGYFTLQ